MSNILGGIIEYSKDLPGASTIKKIDPVVRSIVKTHDRLKDEEAAEREALRKSQEPAERVTTIAEDAAAQKRRKSRSIKGTGKQSTILSGVQTALKTRLGE